MTEEQLQKKLSRLKHRVMNMLIEGEAINNELNDMLKGKVRKPSKMDMMKMRIENHINNQ